MTNGAGLVETLRAFADDRLAELFRARPDVLNPVPSGFDQLASRMCAAGSLARALDTLDHRGLAVAEAVVVAPPVPVATATIRDLLGLDEHADVVVGSLRTLGLVWGPDEALQAPDGLGELFGRHPAGLGPPVAQALEAYPRPRLERLADDLALRAWNGTDPHAALTDTLTDPARVQTLLEDAGPNARAAAQRLAGESPVGTLAEANREVDVASARSPAEQLLARGLFVATDEEHVVLPREVALVLRGGRLRSPETLAPPELTGPTYDSTQVDSSAAGTAMEVVRLVERLLESWSAEPPGVLRAGGLGIRELRRAAKLLDTDEETAALLIECVGEAELVGSDETGWLPTHRYDTWRRQDSADRWAQLARSWFETARAPGMVGTRDERDRIRAALNPELDRPAAPRVRRLALRALADAPAGTAVDPAQVRAHLSWMAPRLAARAVDELLGQVLREAAALGVTGLGALAAPGRALLEAATAADVAAALHPSLPEPVDHVLLQADLTAIAPGPLQPELARELAQVAEAESHGGATVYRFTERSVRHAFDQGQTAAQVHDLLARCSATPVPQPLSYLVDDIARRHGQLRAGSATAYLRCDDEAALSALVADRRASDLRLRHIAPTVVVSATPVRALVEELRALGYAPVAEGPDGTIAISTPRAQRAEEAQRRRRVVEPAPPEPDVLAAAIRAVRTGDRARANRPTTLPVTQLPRTASTQAVAALRAALSAGQTMWMGYVDQHGGTSDRIIDPVRIEGGWLTAYDHASGEPRSFALHRITGVRELDSA